MCCVAQDADDKYRNPTKEAKDQRDLLTDYFNHLGTLAGQEHPIIRTTQLFQELLFKLVLQQFPANFPQKSEYISNNFPNYFQQNHKSSYTVE